MPPSSVQPPVPAQGIQRWLQKAVEVVRGAAQSAMAEPEITTTHSVWYGGMIVDPSEFSQQLCKMQLSLQNGAPAKEQSQVRQ